MDIEQVAIPAELKATDDQLRDPEAIPWVPQVEGVWFKPLRICPGRGSVDEPAPRDQTGDDKPASAPRSRGSVGIKKENGATSSVIGWPVRGRLCSSPQATFTR